MRMAADKKKALLSILMGWAGFAGTFYTINASFPPHQISIHWSLFLPMLASLAFGWRYALLAATLGGAGFFTFHLWPTNGWANVVNVILYASWYVWHGYCAEQRRRKPSIWNNLYAAQMLYSFFLNVVFFSTYPWIFRFNPPFWYPASATSMPMAVIQSIAIKETGLLFLQIFVSDLLLMLPPVRRIFSLPTSKASRYNLVIVAAAISIGAAVLVCFLAVHSIMAGEDFAKMIAHAASHESKDVMVLMMIVSLVAGLQLLKYVERRLAVEDELKQSEERFRAVYDSVNDAIFIHNKDTGAILDVNNKMCEMFGYTHSEALIVSVGDVSSGAPPYTQEDAVDKVRRAAAGVPQLFEWHCRDRSGRLFWGEVNMRRAAIGGEDRVIVTVRDITERKQSEARIEENEQRYRTLFETANDAIFLLQQDRFVECNRRTLDMFGRTQEDILNSTPYQLSPPLQPDGRGSREKAVEKINAALSGHPQVFEWKHLRKDRTFFDAEVSLNKVELGAGTYIQAIVRDVSEKKKLEEQLRQAQKMEAVGALAGGVAHDFNNILTAITGYASLLSRKLKAEDPMRGHVEQILASSERAAGLTKSLLAFSRKQVVELKPVDVNDIVRGFQKILARLIGEDIDFSVRTAPHELIIEADKGQIEQVLMNLATNARDAMPSGGRLDISVESGQFDVDNDAIKRGSYAVLSASDTGSGMDADTREHIFEPFYTTKEVGKGTGLGLAIVYGIVKKHNGVISVYSEPGRGTTFKIYLPLLPAAARTVAPEEQTVVPSGTETILLVEDDAGVREMTKAVLAEFGYTVLDAANGAEAVRLFDRESDRVDLVLCDLIMPLLNGKETCEALKRRKPDIKVIFMSGYTADILAQKGMLDLGERLVSKPLSPSELLRRVRSALDE